MTYIIGLDSLHVDKFDEFKLGDHGTVINRNPCLASATGWPSLTLEKSGRCAVRFRIMHRQPGKTVAAGMVQITQTTKYRSWRYHSPYLPGPHTTTRTVLSPFIAW
jgi:hypothetical protein